MANRFLQVDYDKFENKTVTSMKEEYDVRANVIKLKAKLRHVSTSDIKALVLDLNYDGRDWFFLSHGNLTININDEENIVLEPHESYSDTYTNYDECRCVESDWYELDQDVLKKICDAKTLDFKISGAKTYDIAQGNRFIEYAQRFYNGFYDEEAYKEVVVESAPKLKSTTSDFASTSSANSTFSNESETSQYVKQTASNGCIVTLLMVLSALSSIAICTSIFIGIF